MIFGNVVHENDTDVLSPEEKAAAQILDPDANTDETITALAGEVEEVLGESALEGVSYFDGGEEAIKNFTESAEVQALVEARKMSKHTFVRLNKNDDFTRRAHLASLLLARNAKDPLFNKLALNRVKERQLRAAIFKKYESKAKMVAKKSQVQHIKNMKKMPALPKVTF